MSRQERYFVGPEMRDKLRSVIARVDAMPAGGTGNLAVPVRLQALQMPGGDASKRGTFTGSWALGETKTVTFAGEVEGSTATVTVTNYCIPVVQSTCSTQTLTVIYGTVGGTVTAIEIQQPPITSTLSIGGVDLTTIDGFDSSSIQVLGHEAESGGCISMRWYSVTTCATTTT